MAYMRARLHETHAPKGIGFQLFLDTTIGSTEILGCYSQKFHWCPNTHQVPLWLYAGSTAIVLGLSFPITFIPLSTLFSKVLGDRKQVLFLKFLKFKNYRAP
jgi:hypothetical protein